MILSPKDTITTPQTAVIVINFILGTGLLTLPRSSTEVVHTPNVWISVILGGVIAIIAGVIMVKLSQQFPETTFYQYINDIVGKWVGSLLSLVVICYFLTTLGFQLRSMAEVLRFLLLEGTPTWAIMMIFMWVVLYLIIGGINPIARLFEIILPLTLILFLVVTLCPVLGEGISPVLKGVKTTTLAFTGPEIMLLLLPFMNEPKKAIKAVLVGISIPLIFYVITVVMVIGALSIDGVVTRTWPTLDLIRSFEVAGLIFERFESLLLVVWIMQIFATFTLTFYAAALGLAQLSKKSIHPFMFGLLPILYIIAMVPKNINDLFKLGDFIGNVALFLFGLLPLLLFIISRVKRGKYETNT